LADEKGEEAEELVALSAELPGVQERGGVGGVGEKARPRWSRRGLPSGDRGALAGTTVFLNRSNQNCIK